MTCTLAKEDIKKWHEGDTYTVYRTIVSVIQQICFETKELKMSPGIQRSVRPTESCNRRIHIPDRQGVDEITSNEQSRKTFAGRLWQGVVTYQKSEPGEWIWIAFQWKWTKLKMDHVKRKRPTPWNKWIRRCPNKGPRNQPKNRHEQCTKKWTFCRQGQTMQVHTLHVKA